MNASDLQEFLAAIMAVPALVAGGFILALLIVIAVWNFFIKMTEQ